MKRYSAKLLFLFRIHIHGDEIDKHCEERMITFEARSGRHALQVARRHGRKTEYRSIDETGSGLSLEFIGIMDAFDLTGFDSNEVWFEIRNRRIPLERLIPADEQLLRKI